MRNFRWQQLLASILILFIIIGGRIPSARAADEGEVLDSIYLDHVGMIVGELVTIKVYSLTRVSLTNPSVADIADANSNEIVLIGRAEGQTALFIWDEHGKRTIMAHVYDQSLEYTKNRIEQFFKITNIHEVNLSINTPEGKIIATGEVPSHKSGDLDGIFERFGGSLINMVRVEPNEDLVQIDMEITELTTTLSKSLGIDWTTGGTAGIQPSYQEAVPVFDGSIGDFFKIGDFTRSGQLAAAVKALVTEGKGHVLSRPKLVVISGEAATFLVGGEIPIRTSTFSGAGTSQENVTFKSYGVGMTVTPTIRRKKIDITMNVEISEIDASTASSINEDVSLSTRSASTKLYLDDGQTIVLAGLIKHNEGETLTKVPFVGDIPIIGLLFRSRANPVPVSDTEIVIALTPHILEQRPYYDEAPVESPNDSMAMAADERPVAMTPVQPRMKPASSYYAGIPKEMTSYVRAVQQQISSAILYPQEAKQYGWEGTVKVGMLILKDGTLAFALVKESSGHEIFDEVALNAAKNLAPFSMFPEDTDLQELNVTIPIVYSLHNK